MTEPQPSPMLVAVRQNVTAAMACNVASVGNRPVVLEEFGVTDDLVSAQNATHYYRQVMHSSLLAGATGWIAWNNTDYDNLSDQDPYRHHGFEMHFGLTDAAGQPNRSAPRFAASPRFSIR